MSETPDDTRNVEEGVNFGDLDQRLEDHGFPIDHDEFIDQFGDYQLELTNADDMTVGELMRPLQGGDTYRDLSEIRQAMLNMFPDEAVGRKEYSDSRGKHPEVTDEAEQVDEDTDEDTKDQSF
jgi:hypothetical protein